MFEQTPYAQAFLKKQAFVPYTQEAMNAAQQPPQGDPSAQGGMPPQDPNAMPPAQGGMPPEQGGAPQIQTQPGPNGEPIDVETGFVVVDMQNGIEQDPLTGILFNKFENAFATPEGQPLDPQQAQQILQQAYQQQAEQGGGMPPEGQQPPPEQGAPAPEQGGEMPPQEEAPAPQGGAPAGEEPPVPQMGPGQSFDPSTGMMVDDQTGLPVDPNTGMLIDPATGQQIDPQTGMPAQATSDPNSPFTNDPEIQKVLGDITKRNERTDKQIANLSRNLNATRTDIQGVRRELSAFNDNQDAILQRIDNLLSVLEKQLAVRG